ncbi:MAG: YSC84-related protein [Defluviicoccus sp.]
MRVQTISKFLVLFAVALGLSALQPRVSLAASASKLNAAAEATLAGFYVETPSAKTYAEKARGILVFPEITKAGFVIGGSGGDGVLRVGGKPVAYYSTASASVGLQVGYQEYATVMMFMTEEALTKFRNSSGWEVGVDAGVTVIDTGAAGSLSTEDVAKDPVVAFIFGEKGLMAGLSLEGAKISKLENMEP